MQAAEPTNKTNSTELTAKDTTYLYVFCPYIQKFNCSTNILEIQLNLKKVLLNHETQGAMTSQNNYYINFLPEIF